MYKVTAWASYHLPCAKGAISLGSAITTEIRCMYDVVGMEISECTTSCHIRRVGQDHRYGVYVYTVFLAGKSPNIRSNTVHVYGYGQPYIYGARCICMVPASHA
jgi:hypothetical protein